MSMTQPSPTPDDVRALCIGDRVAVRINNDKPWSLDWQDDNEHFVSAIRFIDGALDIEISEEWPPEQRTDGFAPNDLDLIAAAREGWPADRERADQAEALVRALEAALAFYADPDGDGYDVIVTDYGLSTDNGDIIKDRGAIARTALENRT